MHDGPAIATLVFLAAIFAVYWLMVALGRRALRAEAAKLLERCLVRWQYPSEEWRAYSERRRRELWFGTLRPALGYLLPVAVLAAGLAVIIESRTQLTGGLATFIVLVAAILIGNVIVGPALRAFVRLTRRRGLDYELLIGEIGALELWRDGERVCAVEEHPFTAGGARIERADANGIDPSEIVIGLARPLSFGYLHTEERFLVPAGHLAEAREIAHRLAPPPADADRSA